MDLRTKVGLGFAAVFAAGALVDGCAKRPPHTGDFPVFPLVGRHAGLPCEACHGDGPKEWLPTHCIDCHSAAVPNPDHYPGQNCSPCHVEDGWNLVSTSPTDTHTTPTPSTTDTSVPPPITETTIAEHLGLDPYVQETPVCWDCHEDDRPGPNDDTTPDDHWAWPTAYDADCAPCHVLNSTVYENAWQDPTLFAPVHTFRTPHGRYNQSFPAPPNEWLNACKDCHPDSKDYTKYLCKDCHITTGVNQTHINENKHCAGVPDGAPVDENCLCCHPDGIKP